MQKNDQKNDQEYYIDSVLKAVYIRDLESKKIYSPIYIREKLNSLEEYISHFKDIGLDLHDQQNYALVLVRLDSLPMLNKLVITIIQVISERFVTPGMVTDQYGRLLLAER